VCVYLRVGETNHDDDDGGEKRWMFGEEEKHIERERERERERKMKNNNNNKKIFHSYYASTENGSHCEQERERQSEETHSRIFASVDTCMQRGRGASEWGEGMRRKFQAFPKENLIETNLCHLHGCGILYSKVN
jgi:hypothetical protein